MSVSKFEEFIKDVNKLKQKDEKTYRVADLSKKSYRVITGAEKAWSDKPGSKSAKPGVIYNVAYRLVGLPDQISLFLTAQGLDALTITREVTTGSYTKANTRSGAGKLQFDRLIASIKGVTAGKTDFTKALIALEKLYWGVKIYDETSKTTARAASPRLKSPKGNLGVKIAALQPNIWYNVSEYDFVKNTGGRQSKTVPSGRVPYFMIVGTRIFARDCKKSGRNAESQLAQARIELGKPNAQIQQVDTRVSSPKGSKVRAGSPVRQTVTIPQNVQTLQTVNIPAPTGIGSPATSSSTFAQPSLFQPFQSPEAGAFTNLPGLPGFPGI